MTCAWCDRTLTEEHLDADEIYCSEDCKKAQAREDARDLMADMKYDDGLCYLRIRPSARKRSEEYCERRLDEWKEAGRP